jgi:predicted PurR-regulated permease PerM
VSHVPRVISFIVLLAILALVGAIFFQVMAQFIVPLFLACVLLVVFQPLHAWTLGRLPRYPRLCALITTVLILLAVLLPLTWLGWNAYNELYALLRSPRGEAAVAAPEPLLLNVEDPEELAEQKEELTEKLLLLAFDLRDDLREASGIEIGDATMRRVVAWIPGFVGGLVITGVQSAIGILVGLAILVIALYYFLADGPAMIRTAMHLSPLDPAYEKELLERFGEVSRAVVVATLLSAVVQGALAGLGYLFALPPTAPIFLLTALTMVTSMVPFVGAAAVWICVCSWIYFYGERLVEGQAVQGDAFTAIVLAIYCTIVVSGIDNVIKPLILHGQSRLHPLLALLSILGGVQVLGPVGILVGPMVVSFLQALLTMLRKELDALGGIESGELATVIDTTSPATSKNELPPPATEAGKSQLADGRDMSPTASPPAAKSSTKKAAAQPRAKRKRR